MASLKIKTKFKLHYVKQKDYKISCKRLQCRKLLQLLNISSDDNEDNSSQKFTELKGIIFRSEVTDVKILLSESIYSSYVKTRVLLGTC